MSLLLLSAALCAMVPAAAPAEAAPATSTAVASAAAAPTPRVVTLEEALASVQHHNITWQQLAEFAEQADAGKSVGWAMLFPKIQVQGQWLHMGETNQPDMRALELIMGAVIQDHPELIPQLQGSGGGGAFDSFVPAADTFSAAFNLVIPVLNAPAIPYIKAANRRYDAALQSIAYGRTQLLYAVAKAYYGVLTIQSMLAVSDHSIASAQEHFKSNQVKASLQAATLLQVKRAQLEVASAESQKADLLAAFEKAKASFRYLTGIDGDFILAQPKLADSVIASERTTTAWVEAATKERKDLLAAQIMVEAADHDANQVLAKYLPTVNLIGQFKIDNAQAQRFDDDPYSWTVMATATLDIWDGGFRGAEYQVAKSKLNQARYAYEDLKRQIETSVSSAKQALDDAVIKRQLAETQLDVAQSTQQLTKSSEQAGVVTNLEVIDANMMVFGSEAQLISARLSEAMARLDLLAATGSDLPFTLQADTVTASTEATQP